jgi:hypothetical protein
MTDELTKRRLAKFADARAETQLRAALNKRAYELRPHAVAIVQLLHAVAMTQEQVLGDWPDSVCLVRGTAGALGISDEFSVQLMERIFEQEATSADGS